MKQAYLNKEDTWKSEKRESFSLLLFSHSSCGPIMLGGRAKSEQSLVGVAAAEKFYQEPFGVARTLQ